MTGCEITDAQDTDGIILSEMSTVIMLPMVFVPYTDRINLSVKLFNGVVIVHIDSMHSKWK
jgi:hypothetical protein